jgi:hypothetical protein
MSSDVVVLAGVVPMLEEGIGDKVVLSETLDRTFESLRVTWTVTVALMETGTISVEATIGEGVEGVGEDAAVAFMIRKGYEYWKIVESESNCNLKPYEGKSP